MGFGFVSAQLQGCLEPAPSPKADDRHHSPKTKNPRSERLQYFFKRSGKMALKSVGKPEHRRNLSTDRAGNRARSTYSHSAFLPVGATERFHLAEVIGNPRQENRFWGARTRTRTIRPPRLRRDRGHFLGFQKSFKSPANVQFLTRPAFSRCQLSSIVTG